MLILVRLIGIAIVVIGIIFLLNPKAMKQGMDFCVKGKRPYILGIFRILIGVIFLLVASRCKLAGVIVTLGILVLIKGILIFILGLERVKSIVKWWQERSSLVLRLISLIVIAIGVLLLYSI